MKTFVVLATMSAGLATAELLPFPADFPACGTTCFNGVLGQAAQLGCGGGGSTADAVDGACLCKNINFSYGIIDCANAACPQGVPPTVIQYGVNWCAEKGVIISGLSATPDSSIASSPTATVYATATGGAGGSDSSSGSGSATGSGSVVTSEIISTVTNSDGSPVPTTIGTTTITNGEGGASGTEVVIPISTAEVVSTVTNSDGSVATTTLATSTIFSTSGAESGSGTESGSTTGTGSVSGSTTVTETTNPASGSSEATGATTDASGSNTQGTATSSTSPDGVRQTAAPVGLLAAAGLAAMLL